MKVLIIDDQRLFADGIRSLLNEHDPDIVTEYVGNVFLAKESISNKVPPNLILLSINDTATTNSFDLISRLSQQHIDIPVMVISSCDSSVEAGLAIKHNASGFITKCCRRETTLKAILSVLDGNVFVRRPKNLSTSNTEVNASGKVTTRQQEVLYLLSQGLLNKQIASEMQISANTVKAHLHDLFRNLQVSNRTAAVQYGYKNGLI